MKTQNLAKIIGAGIITAISLSSGNLYAQSQSAPRPSREQVTQSAPFTESAYYHYGGGALILGAAWSMIIAGDKYSGRKK
jgi:hypothetical protein